MLAGLALTDRCDIWRPTLVAGTYNARKREYQSHASDVPCRLVERTKQGRDHLTGEFVVTTMAYGHFLIDVDVEEGDQLRNVLIEGNKSILGTYQVKGGADRKRGKMLRTKRVILQKVS